MNKLKLTVLSAGMILGLSLPCYADVVQGIVASMDSSNSSIIVRDPVSGASKTVRVHPKTLAGIKNGSVVKATLQPGSDTAETIQVLAAE